jgi:hypothetical protein
MVYSLMGEGIQIGRCFYCINDRRTLIWSEDEYAAEVGYIVATLLPCLEVAFVNKLVVRCLHCVDAALEIFCKPALGREFVISAEGPLDKLFLEIPVELLCQCFRSIVLQL